MLLLLAVYKVEIKVVAVPKRKGYIQKGGWFDPLEKTVQKIFETWNVHPYITSHATPWARTPQETSKRKSR